jgi:hypothetical protein
MTYKELLAALIAKIEDLKPLRECRAKVIGYMASSGEYYVILNGIVYTLEDYGHYHNFSSNIPKEERLWGIQFINHHDFYWHTREEDGVMQYSKIGTFNGKEKANDWVNL